MRAVTDGPHWFETRLCICVCVRERAGGGNRTRMTSLEGWGSTIELHPRQAPTLATHPGKVPPVGAAREPQRRQPTTSARSLSDGCRCQSVTALS